MSDRFGSFGIRFADVGRHNMGVGLHCGPPDQEVYIGTGTKTGTPIWGPVLQGSTHSLHDVINARLRKGSCPNPMHLESHKPLEPREGEPRQSNKAC